MCVYVSESVHRFETSVLFAFHGSNTAYWDSSTTWYRLRMRFSTCVCVCGSSSCITNVQLQTHCLNVMNHCAIFLGCFFFCLDCTVQVQRLKSDNFVTFHFEKAFFVHSLHVPANVHLLFSTVHTVRALELGFLATLPLLMIAQWRLELVHTTTVRTRESHPGTVRVHRATHHVSNTAAGVAATTARAASAANRTRLNVHRTYGEWSREDQRDRPFAKRGDQGHCAAGRKQWHREAGVQLIPGQTSDLCDAQILR